MEINRREFIAGPAVLAGALMAPAQEMKDQEIPWRGMPGGWVSSI